MLLFLIDNIAINVKVLSWSSIYISKKDNPAIVHYRSMYLNNGALDDKTTTLKILTDFRASTTSSTIRVGAELNLTR